MDNSEAITNVECEVSQQKLLSSEDNHQLAENSFMINDNTDPLNTVNLNLNSENKMSVGTPDVDFQNINVTTETTSSAVSTDNFTALPKDEKGQLPESSSTYSSDYNMQNYANYSYMYNYNNYYGYPYPQYQWDYNSQQYYQPYQNYYNYNYNANQVQASKPPPPPPDAVQLPVEEKPANKTNAIVVEESNRYSPTAVTDDDDVTKGLSENNKSDIVIEQPTQNTTITFTNTLPLQTLPSEQMEIQQNALEIIDSKIQQPIVSSVISMQQATIPVITQMQPYNIPIQQPNYLINPQISIPSTESTNELKNQNCKEDSVEKVSKGSTVLGKTQAKKRLMAFSMMKQKLQEQNTSINDNQNSDIGESNDVEFIPELNVFQTVAKKKVVTNKKVTKVIKAQQTIEQIEEMKKDELLQGNNAALYQHLLRSGGNEAPILQKLGIESLAEKYSAKIREQDKRFKRHHHRRREDRRGHKHRRRSHTKSRSRSRSQSRSRPTEKPKMRALDVKCWKDFINSGFHFDKFRRFKLDEVEEMKEKTRKSRTKNRHGDSRSDGKNQNSESNILTGIEKGNGDQKLRYNILDRKKEILKGLEIITHDGDFTKDIPSYILQYTKTKPVLKFSENPARATSHLQNRQQMFATLLPEIEIYVLKFLSSMKPKKLKENYTDYNYNTIDDKLLVMMKDKNIYPFRGWWPKKPFIITENKENPNIEIDQDAIINELTTSKRIKKSRFNDDTSLIDIRPTVPSKWDSDYDGSPAADKIVDIEIPKSQSINTIDNVKLIKKENIQEETMDTVSKIDDEIKPNIEVVNICPILSTSQVLQGHAKLDTEYEEFLKVVSAEKIDDKIKNNTSTVLNEYENNLSIKSLLLNEETEEDTTKSSDESVSLNNATEESIDRSFVKSLSSVDKIFKKKKTSGKKSKKIKKKENKRKKHKSSSSESSQDSESDTDSSSEDSESGTTDSSSTIEKKKKKKKSKDKKKKRSKTNLKKKHKSDKNKTKKLEDEKESNSSILNLLEKAFNVEIKKKPSDSEEPKHKKKKKRKNFKNEINSNEENEDEFEKVKECLKETFTKLVKTDKINKNQSLSYNDNTVNKVLKYLKMDEEKEKKKKKSKKRKYDSDNSDLDKSSKKFKLNNSLKIGDNEMKNKKSVDSDTQVLKKKSKKKSKYTDTSETDNIEEPKYEINKDDDSKHFFGLRPNEWNINKKKSSMRGVVHHSDVKNTNYMSYSNNTIFDNGIEVNKSNSFLLNKEKCISPNIFVEHIHQKNKFKEQLEITNDDKLRSIKKKLKIDVKSSDSGSGKEEDCNFKNVENINIPFMKLSTKNSEENNLNEDLNNIVKLSQSELPDDKSTNNAIIKPEIPVKNTLSYRDKVKINLKQLFTNNYQPNISFGFGLSPSFDLINLNESRIKQIRQEHEKIKEDNFKNERNRSKLFECNEIKNDESKLLTFDKPEIVEPELLKFDSPEMIINPQTSEIKSNKVRINKVEITPPKTNTIRNKVINQSFSWEYSEESDSNETTITSNNKSPSLNVNLGSKIIESSLLENNLLDANNTNLKHKNELSTNNEVNEFTFDISKTSCSSNLEINKNILKSSEVKNNSIEKESIILSNLTNFDRPTELQLMESSNNTGSIKIPLLENKLSDSVYLQNSTINLDKCIIDNVLVTHSTSDWNHSDKSVIIISSPNSKNISNDTKKKLKTVKKSRWDKVLEIDKLSESQNVALEQEEIKGETNNLITDQLENLNDQFNEYEFSEEQNQISDITSINCVDNTSVFDYYTESYSNEYDNFFQPYNQCSYVPQYSEMKMIENRQLSPVDYSIYENFNPNYENYDENYELWKSIDTSHQLITIPTTNETSSTIQVGNVLEILPSDNISDDESELIKNENIMTNVPDVQEESVENEKSNNVSCDRLYQLYRRYYDHYNQNPIKYSISNPVFDDIDEINLNNPEELPVQEKLNTDQIDEIDIAIPLRERGYSYIFEDESSTIYLTSDNYIAYCAIEDKCMVHISVDSTSHTELDCKIRHCFNINQNGTAVEYFLHADLIPFCTQSDAESGVFSDDEKSSLSSDSGQEDLDNDNLNNDDSLDNKNDGEVHNVHDNSNNEVDNIIEGEWELIDSDNEKNNKWLDDLNIFKKYGENNIDDEQTITNVSQEENVSSEYDSDISDFFDVRIEPCSIEKQRIIVNPFQKSFDAKINENKDQSIVNDSIPTGNIVVKDAEKIVNNTDLYGETNEKLTSDQLLLNIKCENDIDVKEVTNENPNLISENNDNSLEKFDEKEPDHISTKNMAIVHLKKMNTIIKQQILIQKFKLRTIEKTYAKLPDTEMIQYSDNMETVKHPFLGLFQPPTNSILSKQKKVEPNTIKLSKHVTFADGIHPGEDLAVSSKYDDNIRSLSPPPLKKLMRETFKFKHNMYPYKNSKVCFKIHMNKKKKVAMVTPSIENPTSSEIEYYIKHLHLDDKPIPEMIMNNVIMSNDFSKSNNTSENMKMTQPNITREVTPVPSDNECWSDDDNIKSIKYLN